MRCCPRMRLLLVGCEYAGTTTLATAICKWGQRAMGGGWELFLLHDHFKIPHTSGHGHEPTDEERVQILALGPLIKEMNQRHNLYYHVKPTNYDRADHVVIGLHIEEKIYGPMYFGYGMEGKPNARSLVAADVEKAIMKYGPDTVLLLVKATPEAIARRMREAPHQNQVIREEDVELVLSRFEEEFEASKIPNKLVIDTSESTVGESVTEFVKMAEPFLNDRDRLRLLVQEAKDSGSWTG